MVKLQRTQFIEVSRENQQETRYYITSRQPDAKEIAAAVRSHWGIENNLHWQPDMSFNEIKAPKETAMPLKTILL